MIVSSADRLSAALSDRYRIERELGTGGMATVYLAEDLKHDRKVAVKVLKPELTAVLGGDRFIQEIKTTASLQHPHILPLFDSGSADGFLFYVMPYIDGETLRDKLQRETQLGIDEAVRLTREVADALDYAHRHGIIHRDIKPENILLHDGRPIVADFGIALAVSAAAGGRMTETGTSIGTPHYMSPEQATGDKQITGRADVYSLASVLYEMLAGEPPHTGASAQAVIMKIIADTPRPVSELRKSVPPNVAAAVMMALEKLPADRFTTAEAFATALGDKAFRHADATPQSAAGRVLPWKIATAMGALAAILALVWAVSSGGSVVEHAGRRIRLEPPRPIEEFSRLVRSLAISPDGSRLAWRFRETSVVAGDTLVDSSLWIQSWNGLPPTRLQGTRGAVAFGFSPDGGRIVFSTAGDLRVLDIDEGRVRTVAVLPLTAQAVAWDEDGFMYASFHGTSNPTVVRVTEGGEVEEVTTGVPGWLQISPAPLPEGRGLLFISQAVSLNFDTDSVGVVDFASGEQRILVQGSQAWYSPSGHLVYRAGTQLIAAPFDLDALSVTGESIVIADDIAGFTASAQGSLLLGEGTPEHIVPEVVWVSSDGTETVIDWTFDPGALPEDPVLSPDGSRLALSIAEGDSNVVYVKNLLDGTTTRLGPGIRLAWSADSREVGFNGLSFDGEPAGTERMFRQRADGSRRPSPISVPIESQNLDVGRWSLDQPFIHGTPTGLAVLMPGDSVPTMILDGQGPHDNPTLSPDGRWVAFSSPVSGEFRLFVRPWPDVGSALHPVSLGEASDPQWSSDSRTLYYVRESGEPDIIAARLQTTPGFTVVSRDFLMSYQRGGSWRTPGWLFTVAPDEKRVLISRWRLNDAVVTGLVLVENFADELRQTLGGGN